MESVNVYHTSTNKALRCVGLTFLLAIGYGTAQADKRSWGSTAIDAKTPLAHSFVFASISPAANTHTQTTITTPIKATYIFSTYTFGLTQYNNDHTVLASRFQETANTRTTPLKMITDHEQRNYLALGSRVSTPFINGVYAYVSYHPVENNNPQDSSRLLSLGGRLEF